MDSTGLLRMENTGYEEDAFTVVMKEQKDEDKCNIKSEEDQDRTKDDKTETVDMRYKRGKDIKWLKVKERVKGNKTLAQLLPPSGYTALLLCFLLSTIALFLVARCVLGDIAAMGGTVFALMVLIVVALVGGQLVLLLGKVLSKIFGICIQLPPLLGMLIVGILLKNIPYNFGQFGRLECYNGTIIDTVNELDDIHEHSSWKRSVDDDFENVFGRQRRNTYHVKNISHVNLNITDDDLSHCNPRYIGHELDPFISRTLRTISLNVILLMAGLELDPTQLWSLSGMVLRATLIPCLVEATSVALLAYYFLGKTTVYHCWQVQPS